MMDYFFTSGICNVSIVNEKHNHKMREFFESYKYSEHLKLEEVNLVCEITSNMIFPKNNFHDVEEKIFAMQLLLDMFIYKSKIQIIY